MQGIYSPDYFIFCSMEDPANSLIAGYSPVQYIII